MKKIKKFIYITAAVILVIGGAFMLKHVWYLCNMYANDIEEYDSIKDSFTSSSEEGSQNEDNTAGKESMDRYIDWDSLKAQNPDIVAWIVFDPEVDYPVVQGKDNNEYLHKSFYGKYSFSGCLFLSSLNKKDWSDRNNIIYGHNMDNGSMFGYNNKYYSKDYAKEHPYVYIYTPKGEYIYAISRDMITEDAGSAYQTEFHTDSEFAAFLDNSAKDAQPFNWQADNDIGPSDSIITLSTCAYENGLMRHVIQARLIKYIEA